MAKDFAELLNSNAYPGRGIMLGKSEDGKAVVCYFIMGRSENSRNRIFAADGEGIRTQAFDPSKMTDPSLIIYAPVRVLGGKTIVTNGDQTDTIYDGLAAGKTFEESLRIRKFEPDAPNYTPRISGMVEKSEEGFSIWLSILKSNAGDPSACHRYTFNYDVPKTGEGHFISTYRHDGEPLPSFEGEPIAVDIKGNIDTFTETVWNALNADNKVSLFTRFMNMDTGESKTRIVNRHTRS